MCHIITNCFCKILYKREWTGNHCVFGFETLIISDANNYCKRINSLRNLNSRIEI